VRTHAMWAHLVRAHGPSKCLAIMVGCQPVSHHLLSALSGRKHASFLAATLRQSLILLCILRCVSVLPLAGTVCDLRTVLHQFLRAPLEGSLGSPHLQSTVE